MPANSKNKFKLRVYGMNWKKLVKAYAVLIIITLAVILIDQSTKNLVRSNLRLGETWSPIPWLAPYARIVNWHNSGVAFGLMKGLTSAYAIVPLLVSVIILYFFPRIAGSSKIIIFALGLEMGGALGNGIDRLFYGQVTDFFSVGRLPVINVADDSITIGVVILIIAMWVQDHKSKKDTTAERNVEEPRGGN